jgi:protein-S-isoprenylcysteine O-methyltransferase Ste14
VNVSSRWAKVARRIRVPLGFAFAVVYLWRARPAWWSIAAGSAVAFSGVLLRAFASGHVRKNRELTTSGPYAYTRNPLYLGSIIIATGFALAARSIWIVVAITVIFLAVYLPVILAEEAHLRAEFADFAGYSQQVPRFLPRFSAPGPENAAARFSRELYLKHREYNAAIGAAAMMLALVAKILWWNH